MGGVSYGMVTDSLPRIVWAVEGGSVAMGPQAGVQYDPSPKLGRGDDAPEPGQSNPP